MRDHGQTLCGPPSITPLSCLIYLSPLLGENWRRTRHGSRIRLSRAATCGAAHSPSGTCRPRIKSRLRLEFSALLCPGGTALAPRHPKGQLSTQTPRRKKRGTDAGREPGAMRAVRFPPPPTLRNPVVAARSGGRLLSESSADTQPWRREPLFMFRVFGRLPGTGGRSAHGGRRPKSLKGGNRGPAGARRYCAPELWGFESRGRLAAMWAS